MKLSLTTFGIRAALGASPREVLVQALRESIALIATGLALGLVGALAATLFLAELATDTSVRDPLVFVLVPVVRAFVTLAACLLPARRAIRVDPMTALRTE